jgi:hypothetical protein
VLLNPKKACFFDPVHLYFNHRQTGKEKKMKFAITTNTTTFYHFCKTKAEAQKMAEETIAKFSANFGDTIIKITKIWID